MEITKIEAASEFDLFGVTEFCKVVSDKRTATDDECRAYARWLAMRAGIVEAVTNSPKLEWKMIDRRNSVCIGAHFGDVFVPFPGADQNGAVTFELLDESGNVETAGTIYTKTNGALNIAAADAQAMKESGKAWAKANKGKAKAKPVAAPIAEPAPVATLSDELDTSKPERVRTVSRVIGGMPYGHLQEEHFIVGLGASFEWCEGPVDRWYSQREGRTSAYGEGYATKQEAIDNVDAIIATERATETPQDDVPATTLAGMSEIASSEPEIAPIVEVEAQPNPIAALMARMDALEAMMADVSSKASSESTHPIAAIETNAPLSGELRAKRSPTHIRAIMAYLAMRKARNAERKHNAIGMQQLDAMRADRDDWQKIAEQNANRIDGLEQTIINLDHRICSEGQQRHIINAKRRRAILKALTLRSNLRLSRDIAADRLKQIVDMSDRLISESSKATTAETCARAAENREASLKSELASLKAKIADPSNPVRESDMLLLKGNAEAWQAKAEAAIAESERLKRLALQNAGHIETLASRVAKAETMLRESGALPVLKLVPPTASVAA